MIRTDHDLHSNLKSTKASRRALAGPMLTLGLLCCSSIALAAQPSGDITPSPLNMSVIQGLAGMDKKDETGTGAAPAMAKPAPAPAPAAPEPVPAAPAPAASAAPAATAQQAPSPQPAASAPTMETSLAAAVPPEPASQPAAGSTAADVEKRLSAFDMNVIRALVSPSGEADAAAAEPPAPVQSAQAPTTMTAPTGSVVQPKPTQPSSPAADKPLPESQMDLIREIFTIEEAG